MPIPYTKSQQDAIDHKEGNLQIIACAGSGKTEVISRRIATLILNGVPPSSIVAFTFTEKAAEELKVRIRKKLLELSPTNADTGDMYAGTIHSFCFELLKDFKPIYRNYDVLDENQRIAFLAKHYYDLGLKKLENGLGKYKTIIKFCESVDILREEQIDINKLSDVPDFKRCYGDYEELLNKTRFMDFSGMMFWAVRMLKTDQNILKQVRERYKYITVDEYQDINPIQEDLILLLCGKDGNLCVVGDDDQSIYQWRGTNMENILTFHKRYTNVRRISIEKNFRSTKNIVQIANNVIRNNESRLQKKMDAIAQSDDGDIYTIRFQTLEEEADYIVRKIKELYGTEITDSKGETYTLTYKDFALLFRSVRLCAEKFIDAFRRQNIPYTVKGTANLFKHLEVEFVVKCFTYLGNYKFYGQRITLNNLETDFHSLFPDNKRKEIFCARLIKIKAKLLNATKLDLQELFQDILWAMGAQEYEISDQVLYNLGKVSQVISDFEGAYARLSVKDLKYFLGFVMGYAKNAYGEGGGEDPTLIDAVTISTIHQAKGREYPVVFIPFLCIGFFPPTGGIREWFVPLHLFDYQRYTGTIEDERRLFYVAITRSKKYLFFTSSEEINRKGRTKASLFLDEIDKRCVIVGDQLDPTTRKKSKIEGSQILKWFPTTFSELKYYIQCPYDYKLRFIFGFNPQIVEPFGYGKILHNFLNIIHRRFIQSKKMPTSIELESLIKNHFYLRYASDQTLTNLRNSARKILITYVDRYKHDFDLVLESEKGFEILLEEVLISGTIDLLKRMDITVPEVVHVIDFKTEEHVSSKTDLQLSLYAIACKESLGMKPERASVHNLDSNTRIDVEITETNLDHTKKIINEIVENIKKRNFPPNNGKRCNGCDFRRVCCFSINAKK